MSRPSLSIATGSREVLRDDIVVRNRIGRVCFSTNALDMADRWARSKANAPRGPFTIERVQEVRLRTVLATICVPEPEPEVSAQRIAAISSKGSL